MFPLLPTDLPTSTPPPAGTPVDQDVDHIFFHYFHNFTSDVCADYTFQTVVFDGLLTNPNRQDAIESTSLADADEADEVNAPLIMSGRLNAPATADGSTNVDGSDHQTSDITNRLAERQITEISTDHSQKEAKPGLGSTTIPTVPHQTVFAVQVMQLGGQIARHEQSESYNDHPSDSTNVVQPNEKDMTKTYGPGRQEMPLSPPKVVAFDKKLSKANIYHIESEDPKPPQAPDIKMSSSISNITIFNFINTSEKAFSLESEMIKNSEMRHESIPFVFSDKDPMIRGEKLFTPEIVRQIAPQLTPAISRDAGNMTEIALNPVELGKVRMNMTVNDGVIALQIMAERPETADLLRRHIETLAAEFHALGFGDVTFSFSDDGSAKTAKEDRPPTAEIEDPNLTSANPTQPSKRASDGLDIRL